MTDAEEPDEGPTCNCKVGTGIHEFDLTGMNEELRHRWTERGESVRNLQTYFNQQLLRAAVTEQTPDLLDGEIENLHRLLTDDDVSSGMRTQARNRLDREGIDVEAVTDAFVSHQTVYRHLRRCLDAERADDEEADPIDRGVQRIRSLRSRAEAVSGGTLSTLRDADHIELGEFDVFVDVTVTCNDCNARYDVGTLIEEGGCDCGGS